MPKLVHKMNQTKGADAMKEPSGNYLLGLLVDLLAEQEGVKITYKIEEGRKENACVLFG